MIGPPSLKRLLRSFLSQHPSLFSKVYRMVPKYQGTIVGRETDIVIEGYPRSANTYAVASFLYAQGKKNKQIKVARHQHSPAQVLYAVNRGIPCIVLIRNPYDAILSYIIREETLNISEAINRYNEFYGPLEKLRNRFVVADFEQVINEFPSIIDRVNRKYQSNFSSYQKTVYSEQCIKKIIDEMEKRDAGDNNLRWTHVARPTEQRNSLKRLRRKELDAYKDSLASAHALYKSFL